jgi:RND superfamily putative drug exporter
MIRTVTSFAIRRPLVVIAAWVVVLLVGFGAGTGVFERLTAAVDAGSGSESARVAERLGATAPEPPRFTAVVHGHPAADPVLRSAVDAAIADVRARPGVAAVSAPRAAEGGQALMWQVTLDSAEAARGAADRFAEIPVGTVTVAGGPLTEDEYGEQAARDVQRAEMLTTPVVLVLLLLVFGGLLAAGLPLLVALVGVGATFGILLGFSAVTEVSVYAIQVTTMLAVGLGVDYALLMVNRFREERAADPHVPGAVSRTAASAGRTVLFAGLTVAVALTGLTVFPDPFLRSMGLAGVAVVVVDMLAALTLLPALLVLFGHRIKPAAPRDSGTGFFARVARGVQRRPVVTLLAATGVMVVFALPVFGMRLSEGDPRMLPESTATRQMYEALETHFPEANRPDPIVALTAGQPDDPAVRALRDRIAGIDGVAAVELTAAGPALTALRAYPDERSASDRTQAAVQAIRALPGVEAGGDAAFLADYERMLRQRAPWAAGVVVLGTLALLFALTGSVLLPIKAVLTNALSIGAALGAVVWVFQDGNLAGLLGTEGLGVTNLTVPVLVAAIAFGLSVDYEVFLVSRIRERWLAGVPAEQAVAEGIQRTGRIITSAAMLLVVVFAGFLAGGFAPVQAIGLGLVLAVALDATVVRMLLVPATMTLLNRYNWWAPEPLRRAHARIGLREEEHALVG